MLLVPAGLAGLLPPLATVAFAVAGACALATTRLLRLVRAATGAGGRQLRSSARLLDLGVLVSGLTVAVLPAIAAQHRPVLAVTGLALSVASFVVGLVLLAGRPAADLPRRLRRLVDGASVAASLVFTAWVAFPADGTPAPARVALLVTAVGLAVVLVAPDRPARPGTTLCGVGALMGSAALTGLVVLLAYRVTGWPLLLTGPSLAAGLLLVAVGARRVAGTEPVDPAPRRPAGLRWLTVPVGLAMLATGLHFASYGRFDRVAVLLGLAVVPPLVLREAVVATEARRYAARLSAREAHFRALVSGSHDLILLLDEALVVRWQSPAATRLFGFTEVELTGRPFVELLHPEDATGAAAGLSALLTGARPGLLTARMRDGQGVWRDTESTVSDQRSVPEVGALVIYVRDVGERRRLERTLHQLARTDQLTGLANRHELMGTLLRRQAEMPAAGALLVIDLHGMSAINDDRGRAVGDCVLIEVGRRLQSTVGAAGLVARLAGDEFAVATTEGAVSAYALGTRLLAVLTGVYQVPGGMVRLQVSMGLTELCAAADVDDTLRQADLARRRARQLGSNRIEWYEACLEEQLVRRLDLERQLPGAVARGELDLVYQPVVGLETELPVGAEALLRWRNPVLGTVLPAELLPVAEDLGLLGELGQWVLHRACRQLAAWSRGSREIWMSVNVTPGELTAPGFANRLAAVLAESGVTADQLVLEVSETRIGVDLPAVTDRLANLRAMGVRTALDDFSAASGSLTRLRQLPIDLLKVDPHLLDGAAQADRTQPLIDVVVGLGRRLGLEVLAEGLETTAQVEQARRAGCRFGQGYALSRPATAERVEAYLEAFPSPSV